MSCITQRLRCLPLLRRYVHERVECRDQPEPHPPGLSKARAARPAKPFGFELEFLELRTRAAIVVYRLHNGGQGGENPSRALLQIGDVGAPEPEHIAASDFEQLGEGARV